MKPTAIAIAAALATTSPVLGQDTPQPGTSEFNQAVRDYLLSNPELLEEMQVALREKQEAAIREQQAVALKEDRARIFESPDDVVLGNPDGDVTLVEFFDYNCGVCRQALSDMQAVIEADPNVRFVLKEWPILGPASMEAHIVSRAVARIAPDKYEEFHVALLAGSGRADGDLAMAAAVELGINADELQATMDEPATTAPLEQAYELASALGINGTPSYVLPGEVFFGAIGAEALLERVAAARKNVEQTQ